ncbi:MAG: hypothetical protein NTX45_29735 [Proteobacteria bacterium]|nr:hypothetical protein [Pseudomonadota bacterium]
MDSDTGIHGGARPASYAAILILARSPVIPAKMQESSAMDGNWPVA